MRTLFRAVLLLVVGGTIAGGLAAFTIVRRGLSTRAEPSAVEATLARTMRHLATPMAVRSQENPVEPTAAVLEEGLMHFADHCANCHGNDGRGDTEIGRGMYPPAPDMAGAVTQDLSDGALFSIIENGIRLTGMPAWGTGTSEGARASWGLVHFLRQLPTLTPEEIARMEDVNPRSPAQFREEEEQRRFLAGDDEPSTTTTPTVAGHSH
jgi:mono/diheme cytochrome c family protein